MEGVLNRTVPLIRPVRGLRFLARAAAAGGSSPTFVAAGAGAFNTGSTIDVPYPAGLQANDFLIIQLGFRAVTGFQATYTLPAGWTLRQAQEGTDTEAEQGIISKFASGSETGNLTITIATPATDTAVYAVMYAFRGVHLLTPIEGAAGNLGTDASIEAPSVTTTAANRLAVCFVFQGDNTSVMGDFTGESGGNWTETLAEYSTGGGLDATLQLQSAAMAATGTISGGTYTMSGAEPWVARAFALVPTGGEGPALTNLVGWWKYDDGSGDVLNDYSGNANHGRLGSTSGADTNDPAWIAAGLDFDGVDNYVEVPHNAAFNAAQFTVGIVVRVTGGAGTYRAVAARRASGSKGFVIYATSGNNWEAWIYNGTTATIISLGALAADTWVYLEAKYDGSLMKFSKNAGTPVTNGATYAPLTTSAALRFGTLSSDTPSLYLNGEEAYALWYDRGLSDAETAANYAFLQSELSGRGITLP